MHVNPEIFKGYDVRGFFPEEIDAQGAYIIARAFVEYIRGKKKGQLKVLVGSDARPSSPELKKAIIDGLLDDGVLVIDQGLTTTPFHYYLVRDKQCDGGLMVTASHNPYRYNGIKDEAIAIIREIARRGIFQKNVERGRVVEEMPTRQYIEKLVSLVDLSKARALKVVCDAGGGMASLFLDKIARVVPFSMAVINSDLFFDANHAPLNPVKEECLASLKNKVIETRADCGVAFDPDGDRSGFVTGNARYLRGDYVGAFFAREILKQNPGAAVIYDIRASSIFRETIQSSGGRALESRVGHRFIKQLMRQENAVFAAEFSGHFYFRETYNMDSDFLPMLTFIQYLSQSDKTADGILDEFALYPSSGEINFKVEDTKNILERIAAYYSDARETKWLDGFTVYYDDWWANIRMSNTEPLVRLNVEARTRELLDTKVMEIKKLLSP